MRHPETEGFLISPPPGLFLLRCENVCCRRKMADATAFKEARKPNKTNSLKFFSLPKTFHPPAVRAATLGSWRMLTLGPEYEDTWWVPSPDKSRRPGQRVEEEEPDPAGETDSGAVDTEESSWKACDSSSFQKYDEVLRLDRLSRAERTDGVRQMVKKHEILNNTTWPTRWHKTYTSKCN